MNIDVNVVVNNLLEQIAAQAKENAILKAQIQALTEQEVVKDDK